MSGYCRGREPGRHRECQLSGRCDEEGYERLQLQPPSLQKNFKIHNTPGAKQLRFAPLSITLFKKGTQDSSEPVVSESRFFNLETRMRVSPIQSRSSRRDREFLTLTLRLRDETEKKFPPISGIETRSRFIIFTLRLRDENENSLDLISFFETRPRILKLAIFP